MPSTLPTHPLAVLPLKVWRPRWFDGVALAAGACAPDTAYAFAGIGVTIRSHTLLGSLWWSLPAALFTAWLIRRGAPTVAAHLPGFLREYGVLGRVRHAWWVTVLSALLGVASHLLWDLVTHPGPVAAWWQVRLVSDASSLVLMPVFVWYCGRRHLLRHWHGPAPSVAVRAPLFWGVATAVTATGFLTTWLLGYHGPHVLGVRIITSVTVGLLCAAAAVQWSRVAGDRPAHPAPVPRG
ncbi:DUF4184 family protein [Dactylosporangium fulvum]|uniref:DUF4184 family protein n=1 Tax=Dactylosporangium fulvum TaxID=53359 RepID=A0ABY5W569_9ACTN|nr:DUF4184 family protein [Dactylosporangium fulvum]UWP84471.1 DUF4184 family protein [Dactylosporangium fulvum]